MLPTLRTFLTLHALPTLCMRLAPHCVPTAASAPGAATRHGTGCLEAAGCIGVSPCPRSSFASHRPCTSACQPCRRVCVCACPLRPCTHHSLLSHAILCSQPSAPLSSHSSSISSSLRERVCSSPSRQRIFLCQHPGYLFNHLYYFLHVHVCLGSVTWSRSEPTSHPTDPLGRGARNALSGELTGRIAYGQKSRT
jgi:hypothetical protein